MLACMNIRRNTQLQWTLLETDNQRFGSSLTRITGSQLKDLKMDDITVVFMS